MARIVGISGSLRKASFNTKLLRAAASLMPDGSTLDVRTVHGIPLFDADEETEHGLPAVVTQLKDAIVAADGLLIATPEYNNSMPGVLKNAIDWLSRPPADIPRVFGGKPVALIGASPGGFGTILSQNAWLPVLRTLGAELYPAKLMVPRAREVFADDGSIEDEKIRKRLQQIVTGFVEFVGR
jgi:NAD(P)H-dependent FMN reductase